MAPWSPLPKKRTEAVFAGALPGHVISTTWPQPSDYVFRTQRTEQGEVVETLNVRFSINFRP